MLVSFVKNRSFTENEIKAGCISKKRANPAKIGIYGYLRYETKFHLDDDMLYV